MNLDCQALRVAFAGTPEFAAVALDALIHSDHTVVGVLTQPDRPAGRGRKLTPGAVKLVAQKAGIEVQQPLTLRDEQAVQSFAAWQADVLVVAAYGLILPQSVLDLPALGCLNIHASLLPRWRGAAPIHRAILAGDEKTGVCIMQMDAGLDTGAVLLEKQLDIAADETTAQLHDRLASLGAKALLQVLPLRCNGSVVAVPQPEDAITYAEKLSKREAQLDFAQSSVTLHRQIRAFNPWPVAEARLRGERVRIWQSRIPDKNHAELTGGVEATDTAATPAGSIVGLSDDGLLVKTGDGFIQLQVLQWPGKKSQEAQAFGHGQDLPGTRFENS